MQVCGGCNEERQANQHSQNWSFALRLDAMFRAAEDKRYNGVDINS